MSNEVIELAKRLFVGAASAQGASYDMSGDKEHTTVLDDLSDQEIEVLSRRCLRAAEIFMGEALEKS